MVAILSSDRQENGFGLQHFDLNRVDRAAPRPPAGPRAGNARPAALALALVLMLSSARDGYGQNPGVSATAEAEARLRDGLSLYDQQNYPAALTQFEKASALVSSPNLRFNIALTCRRLQRNEQALQAFEAVMNDPAAPADLRAEAAAQAAALNGEFTSLPLSLPESRPVPAAILVDEHRPPVRPASSPRRWWWAIGAAAVVSAAVASIWLLRRNDCGADLCRDVTLTTAH
jgi:tetratricopeptide (TPR) repeat protein